MNYVHNVAKRGFKFLKQTDITLVSLSMMAIWTLWMLQIVTTSVMFAKLMI